MKYPLLLASQSPRRRELIGRLHRDTICVSTDADETLPDSYNADEIAELFAARKAAAARLMPESEGRMIIAADTVVILDGEIFGKPESTADAHRMLSRLSGKTHKVMTGVCVIVPDGRSFSFSETTGVVFYPLTEEAIDEYIATGEPMDKAGAYGIQGDGCLLVKGIDGDYFNVVGLPVSHLARLLATLGI